MIQPAPSSADRQTVGEATCDFASVSIREVSRVYGRRRALSRVSLECRAGVILGLFGPNGAGKSTLLGILSTLMAPTSGLVRYGERTAVEWGRALRGRIGMLGHDLFLYNELSARENLEFFSQLGGGAGGDAGVETALARARLTTRADDRVGSFSRGLRQRLALERALIHDPRLVLLDEPFTGLDDESAAHLSERLGLLRASGAIIVMATHDFDLAEPLIDQAACLKDGRLVPIAAGAGRLRDRYRAALRTE